MPSCTRVFMADRRDCLTTTQGYASEEMNVSKLCKWGLPYTLGALFLWVLSLFIFSCMPSLILPDLEDKPGEWSRFRGDPACQGVYENGPRPPLTLMWKFGTRAAIVSAPILSGGSLFVGSLDNRIYALGPRNAWKQGTYHVDGAITSSPTVWGHHLYIGTQGERYTLKTLDLHTGKVLWKREIGDVAASPAVVQNRVCVGTQNGTFFAFDSACGDTLWTFAAGDQIHTSAALYDTILYLGSADHFLYALSVDTGRLIWKADVGTGIYATPALSQGRVYVGAADGQFHCFDGQDGTVYWTFKAGGPIYSSAAVVNHHIYWGSNDGGVYALSASTGELLWRFQTGGVVTASPVVTRDVLYVGSADRVFYALDARTGAELWRYETKGPIEASAALDDHGVYVGSTDRFLYAFGPK